jgi:hypothetical protein
MRIVESRKHECAGIGAVQVVQCGVGSCKADNFIVGSNGQYSAVCDRNGLHDARLVFRESFAGVDDSIEVDQVSGFCCRWLRLSLSPVSWIGGLSGT